MLITQFVRIGDERKNYIFLNKLVMILRDKDSVLFPCIVLYRRDAVDVTVWYPRYERWYLQIQKAQSMATTTMKKKSIAVCAFLNYFLWETTYDCLCEININDIRGFLVAYKTKEDGQPRNIQSWHECVACIFEFLAAYYTSNNDRFPFGYQYQDLIAERIVRNSQTKRKTLVKEYNYMAVKPPKQASKKKSLLVVRLSGCYPVRMQDV